MLILAILVTSVSTSASQSSASPGTLSPFCSWKDSNVTCSNVSSIAEAYQTPRNLIVNLVFSDCDIQQLEKNQLMDFNNTASLKITNCNLKNIGNSSFSDLKVLAALDLSWNKIAAITAEMFADSSTLLTALSLAGNPLTVLPERIFVNMMQLRKINLSHCQFVLINEYAFLSLRYLEFVDFSSNNLTTQNKIVFESNDTLLNISNNHWKCDCSLLWIHQLRVTDAEWVINLLFQYYFECSNNIVHCFVNPAIKLALSVISLCMYILFLNKINKVINHVIPLSMCADE